MAQILPHPPLKICITECPSPSIWHTSSSHPPSPTGDMCYSVSPTEYMAELLLSSPFPTGDMYHLYPLTNVHTNCQVTSYKLWLLRYSPDKMLKVKVTTVRSKSRSHHDVAHIHPPNQCPYKISTSYTVWFLRHSCGVGDRAVGAWQIHLKFGDHNWFSRSAHYGVTLNSNVWKNYTETNFTPQPIRAVRVFFPPWCPVCGRAVAHKPCRKV